MLLFAATAS